MGVPLILVVCPGLVSISTSYLPGLFIVMGTFIPQNYVGFLSQMLILLGDKSQISTPSTSLHDSELRCANTFLRRGVQYYSSLTFANSIMCFVQWLCVCASVNSGSVRKGVHSKKAF